MKRNTILTILSILLLFTFLYYASHHFNRYTIIILNNIAITMILAVSYNLINGITGQFSLAPNGFAAVGAYTAALLSLTPAQKQAMFIIDPIMPILGSIHLPFLAALIVAGLVTAFFGFILGFPVFRTRGDYLAIVTLGFGIVIDIIANNAITITNGPLGLKGISSFTNVWWSYGWLLFTIFVVMSIINSNYGRAMKAIRDDEDAAIAMGINTFKMKMIAFVVGAFFQGVAGGLLAHLITTISPTLFTFFLTFNLLVIIVMGGLGSITGTVISTIVIVWGSELLRVFDQPMHIFGITTPGIPGLRMIIFALLLIFVMIFAREGIMGKKEFSWDWLFSAIKGGRKNAK
ncbi:MAG: branched-chain amino acid ABC transporter permease [Desulfurella sp.]|jgi:branched-chain amino acid transport system permease protein